MEKTKNKKEAVAETYQRLNTVTGKYCLFDSKTNELISEKKSDGPYKGKSIEINPEPYTPVITKTPVDVPVTPKKSTKKVESNDTDLKTSEEWLKTTNYELLTKNGWADTSSDYFETKKISKEEFDERLLLCSVRPIFKR